MFPFYFSTNRCSDTAASCSFNFSNIRICQKKSWLTVFTEPRIWKVFFQVFKVSEHLMWPHTYFSHFFLSNNSSSLSYKDAKSTVPLAPELEKKKNKQKKITQQWFGCRSSNAPALAGRMRKKNRRRSETASAAREKQVVPRDASSQTQEAI